MPYYVYIVQCTNDAYYCGYTKDLKQRIKQHNNSKKGAKYTSSKRPVVLKYFEKHLTLKKALKREYKLKKLTHLEKEKLVKEFESNLINKIDKI